MGTLPELWLRADGMQKAREALAVECTPPNVVGNDVQSLLRPESLERFNKVGLFWQELREQEAAAAAAKGAKGAGKAKAAAIVYDINGILLRCGDTALIVGKF